jgi:hypothetical protein
MTLTDLKLPGDILSTDRSGLLKKPEADLPLSLADHLQDLVDSVHCRYYFLYGFFLRWKKIFF